MLTKCKIIVQLLFTWSCIRYPEKIIGSNFKLQTSFLTCSKRSSWHFYTENFPQFLAKLFWEKWQIGYGTVMRNSWMSTDSHVRPSVASQLPLVRTFFPSQNKVALNSEGLVITNLWNAWRRFKVDKLFYIQRFTIWTEKKIDQKSRIYFYTFPTPLCQSRQSERTPNRIIASNPIIPPFV